MAILVGENGAGKSRLLKDIAVYERGQRRVYAVANTVFDRFFGVRGIKRISVSSGRNLPQRLLKKAIVLASRDSLVRLRMLGETVRYCGYRPEVGMQITYKGKTADPNAQRPELFQAVSNIVTLVQNEPGFLRQKRLIIEELEELLPVILRQGFPEQTTLWLSFDDDFLQTSQSELATRILVWERYLVSAGVIEKIDLLLRTDYSPGEIPLTEASSGQLTLIACLVFLAVSVRPGSIVLIDEPENSLHPLWQREYIERLLTLLNFREVTVIIATHAPILVSGAQLIEDSDVKVYRLADGLLDLVQRQLQPGEKTSLEETVYQSFGTVTPANHFVSETISKEFAKLRAGTTTAREVAIVVDQMKKGSFDDQQSSFLDGVVGLARDIEDQRNKFGGTSA
ncbi:AAA family ATPase [Rhizobium ruizarguesonis]|uniref:AAA family ATPase n=1 Tax=Rhizobium ruizarguesonis TaxID=2081791 RepID=UPI001030E024|nr:ATP-binding protein [Rhizobium ruizarguesonis]TAW62310.1 ATP-binding protein [Rhizobium ruizarguesonis]TAW81460.1 ATP-binding protein [Rhizobium ruizarguesonis]